MRVIGLMSGTSYDAIDVAAAELDLHEDEVTLRPIGALSVAHDSAVQAAIRDSLPPASTSYAQVCRLDTALGQAFAEAAARGDAELCDGTGDLVVSHGQTVYHWVDDGTVRGTLQLGQPAWIAERTGLPVVSDLRSRDVACGGQGAPLVSIFDVLLLGPEPGRRGALNLGGIANLTVVADDADPLAYDLGPAGALADAAMQRLCGEPFDGDGERAARGTVDEGLLATLLADDYYDRPAPKSTGKERFHWDYLSHHLEARPVAADDVVATVTELTARLVATELTRHRLEEVFVSGGGVRNPTLMRRISDLAPHACRVRRIDELGVGANDKEAYAFALLGFLSVHGLAGTVPSCTGARSPSVLGTVTPGATPLRLPDPPAASPRRLRVTAGPDPR
jgi:anhydro-N-acetylmuramic acid kinase